MQVIYFEKNPCQKPMSKIIYRNVIVVKQLTNKFHCVIPFIDVVEFEFTRECIVFDLLKIALYHGWLVDPQDGPVVKAINNLGYNQIVEKMLNARDGQCVLSNILYYLVLFIS